MENPKPDESPAPNGSPQADAPASPAAAAPQDGREGPARDNTFGMLCHLLSLSALIGVPLGNVLGPLVIWLVKRGEDPFVDACGKESLNFQFSVMIYGFALLLIAFPLAVIPFLNMIFIPLIFLAFGVLAVATIVLVIMASIKTSEGACYRYPLTLRFLR